MFGMVLWFWGIVVITIGQQCCYFQLTKAFELVTVGLELQKWISYAS